MLGSRQDACGKTRGFWNRRRAKTTRPEKSDGETKGSKSINQSVSQSSSTRVYAWKVESRNGRAEEKFQELSFLFCLLYYFHFFFYKRFCFPLIY